VWISCDEAELTGTVELQHVTVLAVTKHCKQKQNVFVLNVDFCHHFPKLVKEVANKKMCMVLLSIA